MLLPWKGVRVFMLMVPLLLVQSKGSKTSFGRALAYIAVSVGLGSGAGPASAGMLTFPLPAPMKNNVILMRAGESKRDAEDRVETNPVKKLAVTNALTPEGRLQVLDAAKRICEDDEIGLIPSWIYTSNTERAYESATILARECQLGQNRVVPEFSFLDARGMGAYEGKPQIESREEVHKFDEEQGVKYKPPPATDGTPSDSVNDVLVRANQLVSTLEGLYSGENVLIMSPDEEILSILQSALVDNEPDKSLPKHARFSWANGEFRPLKTSVLVSENLVTGQTVDEADLTNRKFKAMRIAGVARGGAPRKEESGQSFSERGKDLWKTLYRSAVDSRLEAMYQESANERL